ncbi:hypothetical protein MCCARTNEY_154 [Bacillus phage vB_BanH_McCartney]|nr:hypothetical protein MCCARTNEY_154 [Bacillus phage vB_BanH_McCartney]
MKPKKASEEISKRTFESVYWRAMRKTAEGLDHQVILRYMQSIEDSVQETLKKQQKEDK